MSWTTGRGPGIGTRRTRRVALVKAHGSGRHNVLRSPGGLVGPLEKNVAPRAGSKALVTRPSDPWRLLLTLASGLLKSL